MKKEWKFSMIPVTLIISKIRNLQRYYQRWSDEIIDTLQGSSRRWTTEKTEEYDRNRGCIWLTQCLGGGMTLKLVESCQYCLGRAQEYSNWNWYLLVVDDNSWPDTQHQHVHKYVQTSRFWNVTLFLWSQNKKSVSAQKMLFSVRQELTERCRWIR